MEYWFVQLVDLDHQGRIRFIRTLKDAFVSKEHALEQGRKLGGLFNVLKFECTQMINGFTEEVAKP